MHAYLIVSPTNNQQLAINNLATKLNTRIMEFPIAKIEDVRNLNNLIKLSFESPTLIVCKDIHKAGEEAANALLKNLEEPQQNIYFVLTTPSIRKVLPTIVSRCQIIKVCNKDATDERDKQSEIEDFFSMTTGGRLSYIDKIKDRSEAIKFAENLVNFMHGSLHKNEINKAWPSENKMVKYNFRAEDFEIVIKTLSGLNANGNVNLQLSNLVIQLDK